MLFLADCWHTPILSDRRLHQRWWATCRRARCLTVLPQTLTSILEFPTWNISPSLNFFFFLSDDFCKEQDPHYFYLWPSCPVAVSSVNFYPNKIGCSPQQSSPGVNLILCHLFYITWNWILKLLLMVLVYWDHFLKNELFRMSNSVGTWHLLGSKRYFLLSLFCCRQ